MWGGSYSFDIEQYSRKLDDSRACEAQLSEKRIEMAKNMLHRKIKTQLHVHRENPHDSLIVAARVPCDISPREAKAATERLNQASNVGVEYDGFDKLSKFGRGDKCWIVVRVRV